MSATSRTFWAVESGELVRYDRSGECKQCGECCKAGIFYQTEVGTAARSHEHESEEEADWTGREDWNMFIAQGIWWYFKVGFPADDAVAQLVPCGDLDCAGGVNFCTSWQDEGFRPICRYWPFHPNHVARFPKCGFKFEKVEVEEETK